MGRIDDALRRAVEGQLATAPAPPDAQALAGEAFPVEVPAPVDPPAASRPGAVDVVIERPAPDARPARPATSLNLKRFDTALASKVVVDANTLPVSREQYRKLAATLHQAQAVQGLKVVMIASAVAGEGKTLTASNLALTLSESYQLRVLLVDGDLRRPSLHTVFSIDGAPGLSEGLMASEERQFTLHAVSDRLTILPAGRPTSDPMAGLTSARMRRLIDEARDAFDWVIIDTPPVGLLPDGRVLASMVEGVVLVVKAGETPFPVVQRALEALGRDRVIGVVLNQASELSTHAYYAYRYEYGSRPEVVAP
jgi:capsular exopolysaccharide synthesis family protein